MSLMANERPVDLLDFDFMPPELGESRRLDAPKSVQVPLDSVMFESYKDTGTRDVPEIDP